MTRILIADEMDLVTRGARYVLQDYSDWIVVGECHSLADTLSQLRTMTVDVVLCGEQIDPFCDALGLVERLKTVAPHTHVILIGAASDGRLIGDLLQAGLHAYLNRGDALSDYLPVAIGAVARESLYLSPTANAEYLVAMQSGGRHWHLNDEARTVLRLLAQGCSIGSIAAQMKVSPRRVYRIRQKLRHRFGATTNEHLISCATAEGYTHLSD